MEEKQAYINYKISPDKFYKVYKSTHNGRDFFNLLLEQADYKGNKTKYYKQVYFKKTLEPPIDGSVIRILKGIENYYGENKYKPESAIMILEYETKLNDEQQKDIAYDEYSQQLAEQDISIDDNFLD